MEEQFELIRYAQTIAKRKTVIILGTLLCLLVAIVATARISPKYEATAQILVSQEHATSSGQSLGESYEAVLMSERLAKTFSQMIAGRTLAEKVIEKLELPLVPEDLQDKVTAKPIRDTQLITLAVTDADPVLAKDMANAYADEFSTMAHDVMPSSASVVVRVVEPAVVPLEPVSPKPLVNAALALVMGLIVSTIFAFLLELLDMTVKAADEVERLIDLPSLGSVPSVEHPLLFKGDDSVASEAYRSIRTNLQYLSFNQSIKTIAVSSPNMNEGKTTVSTNLATVFAQAGNKVLLIDCDLRRPRIAELFYKPMGAGLSNALIGAVDVSSIIQSTDTEGLHIITSGPIPPNPADLLNSEQMDTLMASLVEDYNLIVLDCPPVLALADTAILASRVDAVLLVASFGQTKKSEIAATKAALSKIGARIVGFVINNSQMAEGRSYGYYYQVPHGKGHAAKAR